MGDRLRRVSLGEIIRRGRIRNGGSKLSTGSLVMASSEMDNNAGESENSKEEESMEESDKAEGEHSDEIKSEIVAKKKMNNQKFRNLEGQSAVLLPGITNEITLEQICTKLPWTAFYILSAVSPAWRQAITSHRVHDARVLSQATQALFVHSHPFELDFSCEGLYLYSTSGEKRRKREDEDEDDEEEDSDEDDRNNDHKGGFPRCYELPRISRYNRGIPWECQCVSLDGKIYVLGGGSGYGYGSEDEGKRKDDKKKVFNEVYVLDLVGPGTYRRGWRKCASMQKGRLMFGCGVLGGKIYVFGGASHYGPVHGSEVYDPKADTWSPIKPMNDLRFGHQVSTQGGVFLVYGGETFSPDYVGVPAKQNPFLDEDGGRIDNRFVSEATFMEAYHPGRDEWRVVEPFRKNKDENVFMAEGKFHLINQTGIYVQEPDSTLWKSLHTNSFPWRSEDYKVTPDATVVGNDAIVASVAYEHRKVRSSSASCLVESKGFGTDSLEIHWREIECNDETCDQDVHAGMEYTDLKCAIHL